LLAQEKLDVKIETKKRITKSLTKTTNTTVVSSKELLKAACCVIWPKVSETIRL
jgi:hypothetical protein